MILRVVSFCRFLRVHDAGRERPQRSIEKVLFKSTKELNPECSMWVDVGSEIAEDAGAGSSQPMRGTIGCAFRAGGLYARF